MNRKEKPLEWIGSSYKDLMALPVGVRRSVGYALSLAQVGEKADTAKVLTGFGGAGYWKSLRTIVRAPIGRFIRLNLPKLCSSCTAFRKRAKAGYPLPSPTWTLSVPG